MQNQTQKPQAKNPQYWDDDNQIRERQEVLMNIRIPKKRPNEERNDIEHCENILPTNKNQDDDAPYTRHKNFEEYNHQNGGLQKRQRLDQNQEEELNAEQKALLKRSLDNCKNLPIAAHRKQILKQLDRNQVVIISGDTGCGKTTQVPKYILEHAKANNQEASIICTQPRRIAASNIAKRVAMELGDRVGGQVGYQVGMESRASHDTKIMFVTTGIFLMRLVNNPDSLAKYTHIIMDEVHERDLDTDFSLVVLKHLLSKQVEGLLNFKLILMSATFNTELFANYFSKMSITKVESIKTYEGVEEQYRREEEARNKKLQKEWGRAEAGAWDKLAAQKHHDKADLDTNMEDEDEWVEEKDNNRGKINPVKKANDPAVIVEINARMYKVTEFYVDHIIKNIRQQTKQLGLTEQDKELMHEAFESFHTNKPSIKEGIMRVASIIICDIIEKQNTFNDNLDEDKKGILVFLPGLHEIFEFIEFIRDFYPPAWLQSTLDLIPLHSSLSQDEQDRAFRNVAFMKGKRKVIIATNIAESSITIPDIKYVIDFMLTKELYYDPVSKSESLQLNYSSKASSKQRQGRAGRVSDGFVFRMCSQAFFENGIPEYPKPEMQRCPLEKLILQVKLWGSYEPEEILGRAIQPPEYRDIHNAMKNLQQTGALTIPPPFADKNYVPKITALGKIFVNLPCDIKITRLFLLGMVLKCMHQAIIMGCVHSQTRSIFRGNRNIDQVNITKLQCAYDEGRDSDSIMFLKIYLEWQRRWHPDLTYKEDDQAKSKEERMQARRFGGRRLRMRITMQERKWCSDKSLDVNILRETAFMVDEVKHRFLRMNIPEKVLNSRVRTDEENPDGNLILKTCIGGAFYNKYIKAQYKNEDMLNRMKSTDLFQSDEHQRVLILNKCSDYIDKSHLKQFFETKFKVPVLDVKLSIDKPMIIFSRAILETGYIKACFKLGTRNRMSRYKKIEDEEFERKNKFKSAILSDGRVKAQIKPQFSYDEIKEKLECEELRRPNHLYELRFETLNGENYVDFDMDSINNFTYELDTHNIDQVTFACYDYHDKSGRFLCRSGTRLPSVPMVDVLFCMVFAPMVQVMADDNCKYFNRVICDGGELVLQMTHVLTHYDLEIIQKIRNMLNETLCNEDNIKQAHLASVDFQIKKLLSFQRISLEIYIKLQALRDEDESDDRTKFLKKLKDDLTGEEDENFFLEEEIHNAKRGNGYEEIQMQKDGTVDNAEMEALDKMDRQKLESERGYFLQPIYAQKINQKIYLYDKVVSQMKEEFKERLDRKRLIIKRMHHKCKELALKDVTLLCDKCGEEVSLLKTCKFVSYDAHHAKCIFGYLRKVEIEDAVKDIEQHYQDQDNKDFLEMHLEIFKEKNDIDFKSENADPRNPKQYALCECRNHHLLGYVCDQKYYFTDVSPLRMMFPQGHYEDWSAQFWSPGYSEAFELQSKLNIKRAQENSKVDYRERKPQTEDAVTCELCNVILRDADEFILHCRKDKTHVALGQQFSDEAYDQIFEQLSREAEIKEQKKDIPRMKNPHQNY